MVYVIYKYKVEYKMESGFIVDKSRIFNILIDMSSCLCALLVLSDLIILIMSLSSNRSEKAYCLLCKFAGNNLES